MKYSIILLTFIFGMVACGGSSSGPKATSTTGTPTSGTGQYVQNPNSSTGGGVTGSGGVGSQDYTPLSHGYSAYPQGELSLEFNLSTDGRAYAAGQMNFSQQVGYGECTLSVGTYSIVTSQPGQLGSRVHNYNNILLTGTGPQNITLLLKNSLSIQNPQGEWIMHATLDLKSVNGKACGAYQTLGFAMPTLNSNP